jgi:hypothetical protein
LTALSTGLLRVYHPLKSTLITIVVAAVAVVIVPIIAVVITTPIIASAV